MRTFKDFVLETTGAAPATTTSGVSGAGVNPDKTVVVRPKTHTHPRNELQRRVNRLKPYGVVTHLEEDTEEEQKKRVAPTGGKDNPFNPEREKKIKQMIKPLEEDDRYFRDPSGKLRLKPEYANRPTPGWKRMDAGLKPKSHGGVDRSQFKKAADVLGAEQKARAEEKQKQEAIKKKIKELAQQRKLERLEKQKPTKE